MKLENLTQKELLARCAWCHKVMPQDEECFGAGGRAWPTAKPLLSLHVGKLVPMPLSNGKEVIAIVTPPDSQARADGHDIYFQACSERCCVAISEAIRAELPGSN